MRLNYLLLTTCFCSSVDLGRWALRKIHGLLWYCFSTRGIIGGCQLYFTEDSINKFFKKTSLLRVQLIQELLICLSGWKTLIYNIFLLLKFSLYISEVFLDIKKIFPPLKTLLTIFFNWLKKTETKIRK
jgi:hypothetical protein